MSRVAEWGGQAASLQLEGGISLSMNLAAAPCMTASGKWRAAMWDFTAGFAWSMRSAMQSTA